MSWYLGVFRRRFLEPLLRTADEVAIVAVVVGNAVRGEYGLARLLEDRWGQRRRDDGVDDILHVPDQWRLRRGRGR